MHLWKADYRSDIHETPESRQPLTEALSVFLAADKNWIRIYRGIRHVHHILRFSSYSHAYSPFLHAFHPRLDSICISRSNPGIWVSPFQPWPRPRDGFDAIVQYGRVSIQAKVLVYLFYFLLFTSVCLFYLTKYLPMRCSFIASTTPVEIIDSGV